MNFGPKEGINQVGNISLFFFFFICELLLTLKLYFRMKSYLQLKLLLRLKEELYTTLMKKSVLFVSLFRLKELFKRRVIYNSCEEIGFCLFHYSH